MTKELHAYTTSGLTLYAVLLNATGSAWNGSAFETVTGANWTDYGIALTEAAAGVYFGNMPAVAAGVYQYVAYSQAGGAPATTDTIKGNGWLQWDGSTEVVLAAIKAVTDAIDTSDVTIVSTVSGTTITIQRGDTLSIELTGLGDITNRSKVWWTVKHNTDETDAEAMIQIEAAAGLVYLNGTDASARAANGSITVDDQAAGDITIALDETETDDLDVGSGLVYDVQVLRSTGAVNTLTSGLLTVAADVTRAVA